MPIDPNEIQELDEFFASVTIPQQVELNKAITWSDVPHHVREYLEQLKSGTMAEAVARPRLWHLQELREVLEKAQQNNQ